MKISANKCRAVLKIPRHILFVILLLWQGSVFALEFTISEFVIEGANPLGQAYTQKLLAPYLGQHSDIERLREATRVLESRLQQKGYAFHRVSLPPQTLNSGVLTLEVKALTVGKISAVGNNFFSEENIKRSLPQLKAGLTPNNKTLTRVLAVANNNPAKRTQLTFGRGEQAGTMDAQIEVNDSSPTQLYTWFNNTGSDESTNTRLGLGYSNFNLWKRDHQLRLSATVSPENIEKVQQYGLNYRIPVYRAAGMLNVLAARSTVDSGRVADVYDVNGSGNTLGLGYTQIINNIGIYRQKVQLIMLDKLFDNDVDFVGTNIGQDVRSRPLSLVYQGEWSKSGWTGLFNLTHSINQSGGSHNDDISYALSRFGASPDWSKTNLQLNLNHTSRNQWLTTAAISVQDTSDALIAGEQIGMGGVVGPWGFEEREASFDKGYLLNLHAWMPPVKNASFGAFYSIGHGSIYNPQGGEVGSDTLASTGLGFRWNWRSSLLVEARYGYVLDGIDNGLGFGTDEGDGKIHFNLMYRIK